MAKAGRLAMMSPTRAGQEWEARRPPVGHRNPFREGRLMSELFHECGLAAVYHLPDQGTSRLIAGHGSSSASRMIPGMLVDMQNRGQLAAGMSAYNGDRDKLLVKWKDVGSVSEVFRLNHRGKFENIMRRHAGPAAIGHVRYATCGKEDRSYSQPFEYRHIEKRKWFTFAFNGQLANYPQLRNEILENPEMHLALETDTEILLHLIAHESSGEKLPTFQVLTRLSQRLDGAYNIVYLMRAATFRRGPPGMRPLCYAKEGPLFAAASESVALTHLGFSTRRSRIFLPVTRPSSSTASFRCRSLPTCRGPPTASSSGFISATWPVRSTIEASTYADAVG